MNGIDTYPHDMDDGLVPISAQYSEGCDAVYYGEWAHDDFSKLPEVASYIADQILLYLFGGMIESPVLTSSGTFEHHAGWFPVKYHWEDELGQMPDPSGVVVPFYKWIERENIVGGIRRDHYEIKIVNGTSLSRIPRISWMTDNVDDTRLRVWSQAEGPFRWFKAEWKVYSRESRQRKVIDEIPAFPLIGPS
jgi:hypothetical protein